MRGNLVTFEGPEGGGKSSVCNAANAYFHNVIRVREPGSTALGEKIRGLLQNETMPARSELLLFEAARACIVDEVIKPVMQSGVNVLCDRFYDSTVAYQGYGRGLPLETVHMLNKFATDGLEPDLTIVFDVDPSLGMKRKGGASDRIEAAGLAFHTRVRIGYLEMAQQNPKRFVVIDASGSLEDVTKEVFGILSSRLGWVPAKIQAV